MTVIESSERSATNKLRDFTWGMLLLILAVACIGFAMLYSAANQNWDPWASRQIIRFGVGLCILFAVAFVEIRYWLKYAYHVYFVVLALLVAVEVVGHVGSGAQRWLNLQYLQLQPSELMKIALVLALAKYFQGVSYEEAGKVVYLLVPLTLTLAPAVLVLKQPDLGTAVILLAIAGTMFFLAGVRLWKFALVIAAALGSIPIIWESVLKDYQKERILTFINPERDPLGAGYHILQSKIALGSGGLFGKGYGQGTQSHLNFLPEKQTDFIFTMLAEEMGLLGAMGLIVLYVLLIVYGFVIALSSRNQFGRLVGLGVTMNLFLYMFINIAMVMGLLPVVGVPLPLISYGGTALVTVMFGFGLLISVAIHREDRASSKNRIFMDH